MNNSGIAAQLGAIRLGAFALFVSAGAVSAYAETYTWNGGTSGTWNKTTANWTNEAGDSVAWADGNDAKFINNTSAMTITVAEAIQAGNITGTSSQTITFNGTGTIAWTGWLKSNGHFYFNCAIADDGNGLHFNGGGHVFLNNSENKHTGGIYIKNDNNTYSRAFSLDGGDGALGPVPEVPTDNIFAMGSATKNASLYVSSGKSVELNANRNILIKDGCELRLSPNGTLRIKGVITGENNSGGVYPTGTRLRAYRYIGNNGNNQWPGQTILDPGEGKTHRLGRVFVEGRLEVASGLLNPITGTNWGTGENAALYVQGKDAYDDHMGYLRVSGGTIRSDQSQRYFQLDKYAQLVVDGGTVQLNKAETCELLNGLSSPARIYVRNGGHLNVSLLRVSQATQGDGAEVFLDADGIVTVRSMRLDYKLSPKGIVHFNGGKLRSSAGASNISTTDSPTSNAWNDISFNVEKGGAIFDTSNGHHVWFGRPLVSGVGEDETDGGLTCILAKGKAVVLHDKAVCSYNGPTRLVDTGTDKSGTRTLQCRIANALPATTTLQIGPYCQAGFNTWADPRSDLAQTVARVEGHGRVFNNSKFVATEAIAPVFDGKYGTLSFEKPCSLSGDLEITGDADGCGCIKFESAGQDISGLTLKVADVSTFDTTKNIKFYKVVDAPKGYVGKFKAADIPAHWRVEYDANAVYFCPERGFVITIQ